MNLHKGIIKVMALLSVPMVLVLIIIFLIMYDSEVPFNSNLINKNTTNNISTYTVNSENYNKYK